MKLNILIHRGVGLFQLRVRNEFFDPRPDPVSTGVGSCLLIGD